MWLKHLFASLLILIGFGGYFFGSLLQPITANEPHIQLISIDGYIDPVSSRYLSRSLDNASKNDSTLVIVILNTPGGLLSSTRKITRDIINSPIPVVVYVSPNGAHASSAGTFILASSHIASMAPETHLGAASPIGSQNKPLPSTIEKKAIEDTAAYMRSLVQGKDRNVDLYEQTVTTAKSFTANESLEHNLIDFLANDINELVYKVHGMRVTTSSGELTIKTTNVPLRKLDMNLLERFLSLIANPNIAFLLISLGTLGILIEFLIPGALFSGVFGVIFLVFGFFAVGNLPFNWTGIILIAFGIILFILELQMPGIGVFAVGAIISFCLGGSLLFSNLGLNTFQSTNYSVDFWLILLIGGIFSIILGFLYHLFLSSRKSLNQFKQPSVVGSTGTVISDLSPDGIVYVGSENWKATHEKQGTIIKEGETVIVISISGLTIRVRKTNPKE